jgi:hypothetical protein
LLQGELNFTEEALRRPVSGAEAGSDIGGTLIDQINSSHLGVVELGDGEWFVDEEFTPFQAELSSDFDGCEDNVVHGGSEDESLILLALPSEQ